MIEERRNENESFSLFNSHPTVSSRVEHESTVFFCAPVVGKKKIAKDLEVYPWNSLAAKPTNLEHVPSLCVRKASPALVYQARTI